MEFGPVKLADAEGAILAHSVLTAAGRMRKGRRLTQEDLELIGGAGHQEVVVAQLAAGDVHEDEAATRFAEALTAGSKGLRLTKASTGRVNIYCDVPGVAQIDAQAVHRANACDPMITVATLPEYLRVGTDSMLATVKIISYGVPAKALDRACEAGQGALTIKTPELKTASLIQTVHRNEDRPKGAAALTERLERLGVSLIDEQFVPHDPSPLAAAIANAPGDIVFILTASATSDIRDTAPAALRAAGGMVEHFGLPVDPGNLLFFGHQGDRPVIGLPGCARSPALNGADWIMERVICGVPVTSMDIAMMGVGGLLKDIPTRPRPRAH